MTHQPYREVPVQTETPAISLPIQDSDESPPPVTAPALDPDPYDFPWIRAWHTYLGSSEQLIAEQIAWAQAEHAPHVVINRFAEDDWMSLYDIYDQVARRYFIEYCEHHPGLHLPVEVLDNWLDPAPPRPQFTGFRY